MKIRSITCFYDPGGRDADRNLGRLGRLAAAGKERFNAAGFSVQTTRLATTAFPELIPSCCDESAVNLVSTLETAALASGFDYISFGPALPAFPDSYRLIPALLAASKAAFFSGSMTSPQHGLHLPAVRACAEVIAQAAPISPDGFANLRFAAMANVSPGGPFFPAAYHASGGGPAFALAVESADEAVAAFQQASSLADARRLLLDRLNEAAEKMEEITRQLALEYPADFLGFDFSLAPFPVPEVSLGGAMETLGVRALGLSGSLAAAAFVADALDRGRWKRAGFNGLMLPVLEDSTLAARSLDGSLNIRDLLMFSSVCGTGLDTVPLPGGSSPEDLAGLLLDVAALAVRLGKPLTARLMPIPGKAAGDLTEFQFEYFANGRVLALPPAGAVRFLVGDESVRLNPRLTY